MIEFSVAPYPFFEARRPPPLIQLSRLVNRHLILPSSDRRISEIALDRETEAVCESVANGDVLLFVINHPMHSDAQVLTEFHRKLGSPTMDMEHPCGKRMK